MMKLLIQLSQPIQSADGAQYTAIYGECEEAETMGIPAIKLLGTYADVLIPLNNVTAVAAHKSDGDPELGNHVLVL